jgi:hypothetical protein
MAILAADPLRQNRRISSRVSRRKGTPNRKWQAKLPKLLPTLPTTAFEGKDSKMNRNCTSESEESDEFSESNPTAAIAAADFLAATAAVLNGLITRRKSLCNVLNSVLGAHDSELKRGAFAPRLAFKLGN